MGLTSIAKIPATTIQEFLPDPVYFGDWIIENREFVVVTVELESGMAGQAFTLTRDGAAEQIRKTLGHIYIGPKSLNSKELILRLSEEVLHNKVLMSVCVLVL